MALLPAVGMAQQLSITSPDGRINMVRDSGMYQWSVALTGCVSNETGKAPVAYLWLPDDLSPKERGSQRRIKAVVLAQQNMTEEAVFRNPAFQREMTRLGVGLVWVAPWFSQIWDPQSGCQQAFEEMMVGLAGQSGHPELCTVPIVPLGHSAQATFPWNFAAWNPQRTLCIVSLHGDAPRTNLCGYGTANIEWGRQRNIDGIPGLMVMGEYEWWDARLRPALAFRMMYPASCISFLCDTGRGHFDCGEATVLYIAKFIEKAIDYRMGTTDDGLLTSDYRPQTTHLRPLNPMDGWLLPAPESEADKSEAQSLPSFPHIDAAPYYIYKGDRHTAFWYFDREMALLTHQRHRDTEGKQRQYVGFEYNGKLMAYDPKVQGGMRLRYDGDSLIVHLRAVYTDSSHASLSSAHGQAVPRIEVVRGPVRQLNDTTFQIVPYEAGWDNPRRALNFTLCAVADADRRYKGAVQPINITFPKELVDKIK